MVKANLEQLGLWTYMIEHANSCTDFVCKYYDALVEPLKC